MGFAFPWRRGKNTSVPAVALMRCIDHYKDLFAVYSKTTNGNRLKLCHTFIRPLRSHSWSGELIVYRSFNMFFRDILNTVHRKSS